MDDQRRDGGTNVTLRTKEQGTHLTLNEHDDDDGDHFHDDDDHDHDDDDSDEYELLKLYVEGINSLKTKTFVRFKFILSFLFNSCVKILRSTCDQ